jgi:hypothetical protein
MQRASRSSSSRFTFSTREMSLASSNSCAYLQAVSGRQS